MNQNIYASLLHFVNCPDCKTQTLKEIGNRQEGFQMKYMMQCQKCGLVWTHNSTGQKGRNIGPSTLNKTAVVAVNLAGESPRKYLAGSINDEHRWNSSINFL